jgi:NADH-quinone oxidoreductase subunit A
MTHLVYTLLVFFALGVFFLFFHLVLGKQVRPAKPEADKLTIYECGEPTVGSAWIQFDLRYYVVALLFVIFDVEVAFFFPWAVVFGSANRVADWNVSQANANRVEYNQEMQNLVPPLLENKKQLALYQKTDSPLSAAEVDANQKAAKNFAWLGFADILLFFGVLMVGFAYLWRRGDIDWIRSTAAEEPAPREMAVTPVAKTRELVAAEVGH